MDPVDQTVATLTATSLTLLFIAAAGWWSWYRLVRAIEVSFGVERRTRTEEETEVKQA